MPYTSQEISNIEYFVEKEDGGKKLVLRKEDGGVVEVDLVDNNVLNVTYVRFLQAAMNPDLLIVGAITRDANGAAISAPVVWPDGTVGTYTGTVSTSFPGAIDSYTITYGSPVTKTYTQPALTRNSSGAVTVRPEMTVV